MRNRLIAITAAAAALVGASLSATATVTMSLGDTSTYSGNPSGHWDFTVGGSSIVAGENVGMYQFNFSGGQSVWGVCISPQGWVDYNSHAYDVLPFSPAVPALNSPVWNNGGLLAAAQIMNTYLPTVLAATGAENKQDAGWALTAAIYGALFAGGTVTINSSTVQSYYDTFTKNYGGNPIGYVVRPDPYTMWHDSDGSGYHGQQFLVPGGPPLGPSLVPVPEPTTMIAGIGALGLLLFGAGVHSKRSVLRIGK